MLYDKRRAARVEWNMLHGFRNAFCTVMLYVQGKLRYRLSKAKENKRVTRRTAKWVVPIVVAVLLGASFTAYRYWQGPVISAYVLAEQPLVQYVVATGRIVSTSRMQIGSEITGVVVQRYVREGDHVEAGDILIRLRADDLSARLEEAQASMKQLKELRRPQVQARLTQAEAQLAQAQREVKRRETLLAARATPREEKEKADQALITALTEIEQARLEVAAFAAGQSEEVLAQARIDVAQANLSRTVLRAGFSGTVLTRHVEAGDLVQPGKVLLEIANGADMEVLIPIDERNLGLLKTGQPAICIADAYPSQQFSAIVHRIAPTVDPQRGTVDVRLTLSDVPDYVRDDLTVTATIETGRRDNALAVPNDALFDQHGQSASVWRVRQGVVHEARVTLGLQGVAMTEVREGLQVGDWIATTPSLTERQRVRPSSLRVASTQQSLNTSKEVPFKF